MNNEEQSHDVSFSPESGFRLFIPQDSIVPLERGDAGELRIRSVGRGSADGLLCQWEIPVQDVIDSVRAEYERRQKESSNGKVTPKKSSAKKPKPKK